MIAAVAPAEASGQPERRLAWKRCRDAPTAQCATLRVPVNWAHPRGPGIGLALARIRATDRERRVGSLLFNCGGPGCPSAQLVKLVPQTFTARLRRRFDIVGFDPRGIGGERAGALRVPAFDPSIPVFPATAADYRRLVDRNRALARSCRRMTGPLLMHVGAPATVRDMEAIRRAIGDGKLNWLGLSYGTLLGAEYAYRYPRRVRTLALDGALDHSLSEPTMLGAEGRAAEDVFNRWAAWCNASPECPLQGQDPARVFDELVAAANRSPIPAEGLARGVTGERSRTTPAATCFSHGRPRRSGRRAGARSGPRSSRPAAATLRLSRRRRRTRPPIPPTASRPWNAWTFPPRPAPSPT